MAGSPATETYNEAGNNDYSRKVVELTTWATPQATDGSKAPKDHFDKNLTTVGQAMLTAWPTPVVPNGGRNGLRTDEGREGEFRHLEAMPKLVQQTASGETPSGSSAGTASTGQLNPAFSLWLMGYQVEWVSCGALAIASVFKQRRQSSKPGSKSKKRKG
jgi:hypothetical protein